MPHLPRFNSSPSPSSPKFHVGDIVKWSESGDQLWILLFIQLDKYIIRTLPHPDGSFTTRTRSYNELTIIQSGDVMSKDITGTASVFSYN